MIRIYAERVLEAALDSVYVKCECHDRERCPVLKQLYGMVGRMKAGNNRRIMARVGVPFVDLTGLGYPSRDGEDEI